MPIKNPPIAFLHRVVDEVPTIDTEVNMTKCVAMLSPHYYGRLHRRVHYLKSTAPSIDERMDAIVYYFRNGMQHLN